MFTQSLYNYGRSVKGINSGDKLVKIRNNTKIRILVTALLSGLPQAGCAPGLLPESTTTVSGAVTAGPTSGATVTAYAMKSDGTPDLSRVLASAVTASDGTYHLDLNRFDLGPVVIQAVGGSYTEEGSGTVVLVNKNAVPFTAPVPIPSDADKLTVAVNPLTTMAHELLKAQLIQSHGTAGDTTISNALYSVSKAFVGGADILSSLPDYKNGNATAQVISALSVSAGQIGTDSHALTQAYASAIAAHAGDLSSFSTSSPPAVQVTAADGTKLNVTPPALNNLQTTINQVAAGTAQIKGPKLPDSGMTPPSLVAKPPVAAPSDFKPGAPTTVASTPTPKPTATPKPAETAKPNASPSPTPRPSATPTPSPTASPTATPRPSATPTPTPSPTPSPTATPTATATPRPSTTPTPTPTPHP